jgi:hypothetical protein
VFDNDLGELAELDEDILFDVPDDALERAAATTAGQVMTVGFCTQWYTCFVGVGL